MTSADEAAVGAYEQHRHDQLVTSLPRAAAVMVGVILLYAAGELAVEGISLPSLLFYALQAAILVLGVRLAQGPLRSQAELVALAIDLLCSAALVGRLLDPATTVSGTALILSLKMVATALLLPWRVRVQYASAGVALACYCAMLALRVDRTGQLPAVLHQWLGPFVAAILSAVGAGSLQHARRESFLRSLETAALYKTQQTGLGCGLVLLRRKEFHARHDGNMFLLQVQTKEVRFKEQS